MKSPYVSRIYLLLLCFVVTACGGHKLPYRIAKFNQPVETLVEFNQEGVAQALDRENYAPIQDNPVRLAQQHPVSTFSIDVDTGSYSNVRRFLKNGGLPHPNAVRVEELINYFDYEYTVKASAEQPFGVVTELAPSPWNKNNVLLHIGVQAYNVEKASIPAANLVFLVDVSGSMSSPNKLPLLVSSLKLLSKQLRRQDRISMVVYAGAAGVVLEPTPGDETEEIFAALDQLQAGGSTNGAQGIRLAYAMAQKAFIKDGINRILLATDGDFNVGTVDFDALKDLVSKKRQTGISLTTLGFGMGDYNDHLMEQLADAGNGNYAYIDQLNEANKVLNQQLSSTFMTVAKDVKIQVEFNPARVAEYRLIGYENRVLKREDFNNDKVDAGEIGAGHTVTALYEISLVGGSGNLVDPLRYSKEKVVKKIHDELAFVKLRFKKPQADKSKLMSFPIEESHIQSDIDRTSKAFRFSAAVAAFGQQLRGGKYLQSMGYADIKQLARSAIGKDDFGYRREFIDLLNLAEALSNQNAKLETGE